MSEYDSDAMDKVRKQGIKKARTKKAGDTESEDEESEDEESGGIPPGTEPTRISCGAIDERRGAGLKTREQNEE